MIVVKKLRVLQLILDQDPYIKDIVSFSIIINKLK
jgi:hypothetical protein